MKKIIALALAFALCMTMFAGCGGTEKTSSAEASAASGSDVEYIKNKGELLVLMRSLQKLQRTSWA